MTAGFVSLANAKPESVPFPWYDVPDPFPSAVATQLRDVFPRDGFARVSRSAPDKSYDMWVRTLHPEADGTASDIPGLWRDFVDYVVGDQYRDALSALTGFPLRSAPVEVNLWRYGAGCWLDPHVDKPEKLVTHIIYFNEDWLPEDGGHLVLLGSADASDVVRRVTPACNTGVILPRAGNSWHAVERAEGARERLSAQVIFYHDA
ncbi:hypothetical protein GCM10012275_19590 [Longimycelium tulufanense]|uniref:Prolyl 4-hydroxylase alpha subunit domain-containing protein n=1 Tax=Longimycelium tulufanense TaxID=907463 RepID=A0A8J3CEI6_9PSEU|nr:2OG-Fe(II) oxygenase [Longimycelium tulufanense]GGM48723.1 hypothetical protein GCM10012275_19590 [Longimycelium tulufanense]